MTGALFYLLFHSWKNRALMRIRRLKKPKYLFGAIVGGLYFYAYVFRFAFNPKRFAQGGAFHIAPENVGLFETGGALVLCIILLLGWLIPHERAALIFSEAEVAFLFPAPVSRKKLIHYKLLKSQLRILFTILVFTIVFGRFRSGGSAWTRAVGWWVIFSTLNLHLLGSSFARTILLEHGISNWKRRIVVLLGVVLAVGAMAVWGSQTMTPLNPENMQSLPEIRSYFQHLLETGPLPYILYPFRLVVHPYLSTGLGAFLIALWPALLLMGAHYLWVVKSNVAFEEASVEASRKMAERVASIRANRGQATGKPAKKKRAPFKLRPNGWPAVGFLWKNLISAGQAFTLRFWLIWIFIAIVMGTGLGNNPGTMSFGRMVGLMALVLLGISFVLGPQIVRQDFRHDLPMMDVLKTYPLSGWELALGELLAPAVILTGMQWLLVVLCLGTLSGFGEEISMGWRLAVASGVAVIAPVLNLVTLIIPNVAVVLFPGWFQTGKDAPQGIEATGQRLIFAIGQLVVFVAAVVPAAVVFAVVYFLGRLVLGDVLPVPIASVSAAAVLGAEAWLGLLWLGKLFERFDLSAESVTV
ncbi:MAG: hypothetical protein JWR26_383 [Pedosphaera sp.]|nr:hypothetical protein [Pedosphaera sp.]